MVKFLLHRPIAVCMATLAFCLLGILAYGHLGQTLLPNIPIPELTVYLSVPGQSAESVEQSLVTPLRNQLMQVGGLEDINTTSDNGRGVIKMRFRFSKNIDKAFIETNEKIDRMWGSGATKGVSRPMVVKTSASDIPSMTVVVTLRNGGDDRSFDQLCELVSRVIKFRLEQLDEVAVADVGGLRNTSVILHTDDEKLRSAGLTPAALASVIKSNNTQIASITVRDGYYKHNLIVDNSLTSAEEIARLNLKHNGRIYSISDFCTVEKEPDMNSGVQQWNGLPALTINIIKKEEGNNESLRKNVEATLRSFSRQYPELEFETVKNQTELLDYSIFSLQQNIVLGFVLMFLVAMLLIGNLHTPVVTGISMAVSILLTFLAFYIFGISINIVSLSGLLLVIGMMIDNSLIASENIRQHEAAGHGLLESCARGTSEMITPMLSSTLTTVAVFAPLIFMSDVAGALFSNQAYSIIIGLGASYVTAIILLPVIYLITRRALSRIENDSREWKITRRLNSWLFGAYEGCFSMFFNHRAKVMAAVLLLSLLLGVAGIFLRKEYFPATDQTAAEVLIDWNENIPVSENLRRIEPLLSLSAQHKVLATAGIPGYLLGSAVTSENQAELFIETHNTDSIRAVAGRIVRYLKAGYPEASVSVKACDNVFTKIFDVEKPSVYIRARDITGVKNHSRQSLQALHGTVAELTGVHFEPIPFQQELAIAINQRKAETYGVRIDEIYNAIESSLKGTDAGMINTQSELNPIVITPHSRSLSDVLAHSMLNIGNQRVALSEFIELRPMTALKQHVSDNQGRYYQFTLQEGVDGNAVADAINDAFANGVAGKWQLSVWGNWFESRELMRSLALILLVALLLMYFILCAQFESFTQPLIILTEIPIDIALALGALYLTGGSLNLMSGIGIIASCGVVINDSILKLDEINRLRRGGMPLLDAIHTAGRRRLKAIVMTTLTTVLAMVPVFFTHDIGSQLQQPLALTIIVTITGGTLVSLFFVPLVYYFIHRHEENKEYIHNPV